MKNNIKVVNSPIVKQVEDTMKFYERKLTKLVAEFVEALTCAILIGIMLNIISASIYPEFPTKFPTIFGFYDQWAQFGEILFKSIIKFVDAIFRGNFSGFAEEFSQAITEWFSQFLNWVETLAY